MNSRTKAVLQCLGIYIYIYERVTKPTCSFFWACLEYFLVFSLRISSGNPRSLDSITLDEYFFGRGWGGEGRYSYKTSLVGLLDHTPHTGRTTTRRVQHISNTYLSYLRFAVAGKPSNNVQSLCQILVSSCPGERMFCSCERPLPLPLSSTRKYWI